MDKKRVPLVLYTLDRRVRVLYKFIVIFVFFFFQIVLRISKNKNKKRPLRISSPRQNVSRPGVGRWLTDGLMALFCNGGAMKPCWSGAGGTRPKDSCWGRAETNAVSAIAEQRMLTAYMVRPANQKEHTIKTKAEHSQSRRAFDRTSAVRRCAPEKHPSALPYAAEADLYATHRFRSLLSTDKRLVLTSCTAGRRKPLATRRSRCRNRH